MSAYVDPVKCDGCGDCARDCPLHAIAIVNGMAIIDEEVCSDCGSCVDICPKNAISSD